jgi:hypothetical protein
MACSAAGASLSFFVKKSATQVPKLPGPPAHPSLQDDDDNPIVKTATKAALEDNDKDIKKKIEKLYDLATALKAEVEKTDSAKVLSLAMIKKAEEIEKLARDIKTRARG